jgi:hypothetical protein
MFSTRLVAFSLIGLITGSGSAQAESFVEGHVFNLRTGVPVARALVVLTPSVPLYSEHAPPGCVNCASRLLLAITDDNGFYSVHFSDAEVDVLIPANVTINVICHTNRGPITTGQTAPVDIRDGTVQRNLYLPLRPRPRGRTCLGLVRGTPGD